MHRQTIIQNHIQKSKPRTRKLLPPPRDYYKKHSRPKTVLFETRPWLHRTPSSPPYLHTRARAQDASLPRFSPFNGGEGRGRKPVSRLSRYTRIYPGEEPGGVVVRYTAARDERTKRVRGEEGEQEESQFSNGPGESGVAVHIYWPTLPSSRPHPRHPPSAATNCPVTTPRTRSGRPVHDVIGATH